MADFRHFTQTIQTPIEEPRAPEIHEDYRDLTPSRKAAYAKLMVLEKYSVVFGNVKIASLNMQPILLSRPYVMSKIEAIYDNLVERVLKNKTVYALAFVPAMQETLREKYNESLNYYHQSLCNILYSVDKYRDSPEVALFIGFIRNPNDLYQLLFYLYLRQHFKVITYTSFIAHNKTEKDPTKIFASLKVAYDILNVSFNFDPIILDKMTNAIKSAHGKNANISFYEFLSTCCSLKMNYKDLPMIDRLISLYAQKTVMEDIQENAQKMRNSKLDTGKLATSKSSKNFDPNDDEYSFDGTKTPDGKGFVKRRTERNAYGYSKIRERLTDAKDKEIFQLIKSEIHAFAMKLVSGYVKKYKVPSEMIGEKLETTVEQINKKIFNIVGTIFLSERNKFLALLRVDSENDEEMMGHWVELHDTLESLKRFPVANRTLGKEYLYKVFKIPALQEHIEFFLNFHFENDGDVLDPHVELEIEGL
jgi:hypothetical protein